MVYLLSQDSYTSIFWLNCLGFGILPKDTLTCIGLDRTTNPPISGRSCNPWCTDTPVDLFNITGAKQARWWIIGWKDWWYILSYLSYTYHTCHILPYGLWRFIRFQQICGDSPGCWLTPYDPSFSWCWWFFDVAFSFLLFYVFVCPACLVQGTILLIPSFSDHNLGPINSSTQLGWDAVWPSGCSHYCQMSDTMAAVSNNQLGNMNNMCEDLRQFTQHRVRR